MKPVIFGTTGMVGKGVLLECLEDPRVEKILVINRSSLHLSHPKLTEIIHGDFFDFSSLKEILKEYDACFFCMGVSVAGMSEQSYRRITYDITLSFARTFFSSSPNAVFCYVSGAGTNSESRQMWSRIKGKTENDLLSMGFRKAYMFRPGYIQPMKGVRSKTGWYNLAYVFLKPLYFLLKPFKSMVTDSVSLGKAMINVVASGYEKSIIESKDINILGK